MDKAELQKLWEDPANWSALYYNCAADPRLIVPKRNQMMGWTINAAHGKRTILIIVAGFLIAIAGPMMVLLGEGVHMRQLHLFIATLVSAGTLCLFCWYFSNKTK